MAIITMAQVALTAAIASAITAKKARITTVRSSPIQISDGSRQMNNLNIAISIILIALAFCIGTGIGMAAEKNYIKTHCELLGKLVIDGVAYECRKLSDK